MTAQKTRKKEPNTGIGVRELERRSKAAEDRLGDRFRAIIEPTSSEDIMDRGRRVNIFKQNGGRVSDLANRRFGLDWGIDPRSRKSLVTFEIREREE